MRRCISTEGLTAHLMYRWRGQPLSVYVLNRAHAGIGPVAAGRRTPGQEAVMWSKGDRTYAVVARGQPVRRRSTSRQLRPNGRGMTGVRRLNHAQE